MFGFLWRILSFTTITEDIYPGRRFDHEEILSVATFSVGGPGGPEVLPETRLPILPSSSGRRHYYTKD